MTKFYNNFDVFLNEAFQALATPTNFQTQAKYPPYNLIRLDTDITLLELAVAGFTAEDLSVEIEDSILIVKGSSISNLNDDGIDDTDYIYRGLSNRSFTRKFALHEYMEVVETELKNGILSIQIRMEIPESKKPKKVEINVR